MPYFLRPMTPKDAYTIVNWRYPGEYAFYNMDADPQDLQEFLDVAQWEPDTKFAVANGDGDLVGFFEFEPRDGVTAIGLGLRPDWTGKGQGESFLQAGLSFAMQRYKPRQIRLAVATFNKRAITLYQRVGFTITKTLMQNTNGGVFEFVEMEADPLTLRLQTEDQQQRKDH